MGGLGISQRKFTAEPHFVNFIFLSVCPCGPHLSAIRGWPLQTADIKTHLRASQPLPEQELREAHSRNMLMLLWNVARVDRLAAIPPKADIGTQSRNVRYVPKADIVPLPLSQPFESASRKPRRAA